MKPPADERHLRRCLELAARGVGAVEPNPRVGAVVVRNGRVVGEGYHRRFGGPHAEVQALARAGRLARGATLYVSLEPCCHFGKTPPCIDRIVESGIRAVVAPGRDPNPVVLGKGFAALRRRGIRVRTGPLAREAEALNPGFFKYHRTGLPYVAAKWAMTLDGKIATRTGDSRWISGEASRAWLRKFRDRFQAILVGSHTAFRDDPGLRGRRQLPVRIVLDSTARLPLESRLVKTARAQRTLVAVAASAPEARIRKLERAGVEVIRLEALIDLRVVMEELGRAGIHSILVEGGGEVHASVFEAGVADEVVVFVGPKVIGGREAKTPVEGEGAERMVQAVPLEDVTVQRIGDDAVIRGRVVR